MAELLYEGKAKQVYKTEKEDEYLIHYKDDATAFNGEKKAQISSKGILNNNKIFLWNIIGKKVDLWNLFNIKYKYI